MEEIMAKEHEMLSLGGQAAAAAHSLGTPLSTIKIIIHWKIKRLLEILITKQKSSLKKQKYL